MKKRICSVCKQEKDLETDFYPHGSGRGGYRAHCKVCAKTYKSQSSEAVMARVRRMRDRNRQYVWDYYNAHVCIDCGEADPIVLEFDHVRGKKTAGVSELVHACRSIKIIDTEIAKCDVVCANCHRRRTADSQGWHSELAA